MPQPMCRHHYAERSKVSTASIDRCRLLDALAESPDVFRLAVEAMARVLDEQPTFDTCCRFDGGPRCPSHEA